MNDIFIEARTRSIPSDMDSLAKGILARVKEAYPEAEATDNKQHIKAQGFAVKIYKFFKYQELVVECSASYTDLDEIASRTAVIERVLDILQNYTYGPPKAPRRRSCAFHKEPVSRLEGHDR